MGLNPNVIITKKEKFRKLYDDISEFVHVQGRFNGVYPNLLARLNDTQKNILSELRETFYDNSYENNDPKYVPHIEKAVSFLKEILGLIEKPIVFSNNYEMSPFEKRYSFVTNPEHDGFHLGSSFLTKTPNGESLMKLSQDEVSHIYGFVRQFDAELYEMPEWLESMGPGLYSIDGYRFDVRRFTSFGENYLRHISIYAEESDAHPIVKYFKRNDYEPEEYEVNCSSCGDGGCVHCDPGFFM